MTGEWGQRNKYPISPALIPLSPFPCHRVSEAANWPTPSADLSAEIGFMVCGGSSIDHRPPGTPQHFAGATPCPVSVGACSSQPRFCVHVFPVFPATHAIVFRALASSGRVS